MRKVFLSVLAGFLFHVAPAMAWGLQGHRVVAQVAYHYMSRKAIKQVDALLGTHGMINWSSWPDEIKSDTIYPDSYDWHFQDLDEGMSDSAVVAILTDYPTQGGNLIRKADSLLNALQNDHANRDALVFVIHLTADKFCPMHIAHVEDIGGNNVQIQWLGKATNLHKVWDEEIIKSRGYSYSEYADFLINRYDGEHKRVEQMTWGELLCMNYRLTSDIYAYHSAWNGNAYRYIYDWKQSMEWQLYVAGVRLAQILNEIYK